MGSYSSAIDGIPGIIPGTVKVPPPPEFESEEVESTQPMSIKNLHPRKLNDLPRHQRRMMPCNKENKN